MAKCSADSIYSFVVDPSPLGIQYTRNCPEDPVTSTSCKEVFLKGPFKLPHGYVKVGADVPHFQQQLTKMFLENQQAAIYKMREGVQSMKGISPSNSVFGAIDLAKPLDFKAPWMGESAWFELGEPFRQALLVTWTEVVDVSPAGWPFQYMPVFLTQYVGTSTVVVVDTKIEQNHGQLPQYLDNCGAQDLDGYPTFHLQEGSSIFVPLGHVPIILCHKPIVANTGPKVDLKERVVGAQHNCAAVGVYPLLDIALAQAADKEKKQKLAATFLTTFSHLPNSWQAHEQMAKFKDALAV